MPPHAPRPAERAVDPLYIDPQKMDALRDAAAAASVTLDDPGLRYAFTVLEQRYIHEWRNADTPDAREAAWFRQRALYELGNALRDIVDMQDIAVARQQADAATK